MVVKANDRCKAPTFLVDVEFQCCQLSQHGVVVGNDVAAVETVVVVGSETDGCREEVGNLVGQVQLSAKDVLLALHLRVKGVLVGGDAVGAKQAGQHGTEHRYTVVVLNVAAAAYDANHRGDGPAVFLVAGEEGGHDGGRGLTVICYATILDVAVLPGLLEVERQLETVVAPCQSGGVRVGGVNLGGGTACHHAVEGYMVVCVGHQTTGVGC